MEQLTPPQDFGMAAHQQVQSCSFRLTHCLNEGQMTPPSSPLPPCQNGSRLQLSRLLRRSKSVRTKASGMLQDRYRAVKPRPSVTNMRAPFPLLLPESPSGTEDESSCPSLRSAGLRRMSVSYKDLRALAQRQANSSPVTPLLPSPITRDFCDQSYFDFRNPGERPYTSSSNGDSLDTCNILSYYCDEADSKDEHSDAALEDDNLSTASESMPRTPLEQEHQLTYSSDESGWLANTTSHDQRMRRFKARYYQVVQQPWTKVHTEDY